MGHILHRLIAAVLLTLLLVGFAGSSALAAPRDDCGIVLAVADPRVALATTDDCGSHHHGNVILDHPVLNNPVFNTYNNPVYINKNNTYRYYNRYNNRYNNAY